MRTPSSHTVTSAASEQLAQKLAIASAEVLGPLLHTFELVIAAVSQASGLSREMFTGQRKMPSAMEAKIMAVALAVEFLHPPLDMETIGRWLDLSRSTIQRLHSVARQRMESDPGFRNELETLRARICEALKEPTA